METAVVVSLISALVALFAPLVTYLVAVRKMSGRIRTTEADELWAEARSQRQDYRDRLSQDAERIRILEERVDNLERENNRLAIENYKVTEYAKSLERQLQRVRGDFT